MQDVLWTVVAMFRQQEEWTKQLTYVLNSLQMKVLNMSFRLTKGFKWHDIKCCKIIWSLLVY